MAKDKYDVTAADGEGNIVSLTGMYREYFLDYASYVILERAVPSIVDGFKPVQRRILHALKQMDDGRFHKVANVIGQTMQYHPHGDMAIGDALVKIGQKNLLIDTQGNWGDPRTGDRAAASRYIEARLTKFALDVAFNPNTTEWQLSYDGRKNEPINLPMKFPMVLATGAEGIAVGLSTKILPHNFIELIKGSISVLKGRTPKLKPDFPGGGMMDATNYNDGKRGGKIRVRARMHAPDKKTILITELPYGVTTNSLIDSIIKANDKGTIKIKKVVDNTAKNVEILIELQPGSSPNVTIDALYAFTNCETSISPNCCVIMDNKPHFLTVSDLLRYSTEATKELLRMELEIKKADLLEKLHFASLEKIFIKERIYRDIEESETWEEVLKVIRTGLAKYVVTPSEKPKKNDKRIRLLRDITEEDIVRLTEIKIKRISKYNSFKADERIANLEEELKEVEHHLANLVDYTIAYYQNILSKYGKGKERKTEITTFDTISRTQVVAINAKLYVNRQDGFVGKGMKKDEFVADCSDIDDIIVFRKDGKCVVTRIADKTFVGKDILHVAIWKKGDERTTYNMIYSDGKDGRTRAKRFHISAITRDKEYDLTKGNPKSKVSYFSANPNGEAEIINIQLTQGCTARIKSFDFGFSDIEIKGRGSQGNIVTKYPVKKVTLKSEGMSSLGAQAIWYDELTGRLNTNKRGIKLGDFDTGELIIAVQKDGTYRLTNYELTNKYDINNTLIVKKYDPMGVLSAIYYDGNKGWSVVKRFEIETTGIDTDYKFITDHPKSKLLFATLGEDVEVAYKVRANNKSLEGKINLSEFVDVKGWKAIGNKLSDRKLIKVTQIDAPVQTEMFDEPDVDTPTPPKKKSPAKKKTVTKKKSTAKKKTPAKKSGLKPGDSIEFDV